MQVSGLLMCHVCQLWCVTPEANYKCEITHQLLPPANWGLTKRTENKVKILNIKIVFRNSNRIVFHGGILLCHTHMELMCVISTGCFHASGCF